MWFHSRNNSMFSNVIKKKSMEKSEEQQFLLMLRKKHVDRILQILRTGLLLTVSKKDRKVPVIF